MTSWARYGLLALATVAGSAKWVEPTETVPAYYAIAPLHTTAPVMSGSQLTGAYFSHDYQVAAYQMAGKIDKVLYQQPCYCRCDLALRHKSLHSCFEGTHGAVCATCMRQTVYAYQQTQLGQTPQEIRAGIERGEWKQVRLEDATPLSPIESDSKPQ